MMSVYVSFRPKPAFCVVCFAGSNLCRAFMQLLCYLRYCSARNAYGPVARNFIAVRWTHACVGQRFRTAERRNEIVSG